MVYFSKEETLDAIFIRKLTGNYINNGSRHFFSGEYELIDLNKFTYQLSKYSQGRLTSEKGSITGAGNNSKPGITTNNSWFGQLLRCLSRYIVAVPARGPSGKWDHCWVLGGGNSGEGGTDPGEVQDIPPPEGGGNINWEVFLNNIIIPENGPDPIPGGVGSGWNIFAPPSSPPSTPPPGPAYNEVADFIADGGLIADEPDPDASDTDSKNIWWDDNISDPNTEYQLQSKPSWDNVYTNYPKNSNGDDMSVLSVRSLIGGEIGSMYIPNACALRVSRALNYSGITIPEINAQTKKGADGKNYFLYASHLKNWLVKTLGPPDIHKTAADGAPNGNNFRNLLVGIQNRGIYIMKPMSANQFNATGHATLWGGLDCIGGHNYFGAASDIYIWKLPQ